MSRVFGIALAVVTAALFGAIPIAGKVALSGLSELVVPFLLLALTAALLAVGLAAARPDVLRTLKEPPRLVGSMGLALGLNHILYYVGLFHTTATSTEVIIQLAPVFLVVIGVTFFGERFGAMKAGGAALAIAGVVVISWNGAPLDELIGSGQLLGNALVAGAALLWALYAAGQKLANRDHPPQAVLLAVYTIGAAVALPMAVVAWPATLPTRALLGVVALALATLGSFGSFAEALEHAPASTLAVVTTTAPLFTIVYVIAAKAWFPSIAPPETLTLLTWLGAGLVVIGVGIVSRARGEAIWPAEGQGR